MNPELIAEIELPADQVRAVRLVAGRIAVAEGFGDEVVEDVKLAVGEACSRLVSDDPHPTIRVRFQRDTDTFVAEFAGFPAERPQVRSSSVGAAADDPELDFAWLILTAVAPELVADGGILRLAWPLPHVGASRA